MQSGPAVSNSEPRYPELDSLRGVAALTVVFHHFHLMWRERTYVPRWLSFFNPVTAGYEAVMLFFLLSGFVLSIPYIRGKGQSYPVYALRRILRIYAPYLFALALAIEGASIWHGRLKGAPWANLTWSDSVSARLVFDHVIMIGKYDWSQFNTAFWSLAIEMRISLVFPLLYLLVRRMGLKRALALTVAGTIAANVALKRWPAQGNWIETAQFAMIFIVGILLAQRIDGVSSWYRRLSRVQHLLFAASALILYTYGGPYGHRLASYIHLDIGLDQVLISLGATAYLIIALNAPWARSALSNKVARFLGRISYSLYLVHGTVLFAMTRALGARIPIPLQFVLYLAASIGIAYLFCLGIEEPFLRLSRRVGKLARTRDAAKAASTPIGLAT